MPTLWPFSRARPVTAARPKRSLRTKRLPSSTMPRDRPCACRRSCCARRARTRAACRASGATASAAGRTGRRSAGVRRQVAEKAADRGQRLRVAVDDAVDQTGGFGMQLPAAEFFGIDGFADRQRGDARARHRQERALAHDHEVRQAGVPGRRAEAGAEHGADPGDLAAPAILLRILAARGHRLRAQRVLDARAARLAEEDQRHAVARGRLLQAADLAHVDGRRRRALDRHVVRHHGHAPAFDAAGAGDLAVGRRTLAVGGHGRHRQQAGLAERAGVEQLLDALARVQVAGCAALRELGFAAHGQRDAHAGVELGALVIVGRGAGTHGVGGRTRRRGSDVHAEPLAASAHRPADRAEAAAGRRGTRLRPRRTAAAASTPAR